MQDTIYISCPFCGESDFDLIGLKLHISRGWCDSYNALETVDPKKEADLILTKHRPGDPRPAIEGIDYVKSTKKGEPK